MLTSYWDLIDIAIDQWLRRIALVVQAHTGYIDHH